MEEFSLHCLRSVRFRSYSGPYFLAFGLNTERYSVSLRIHSECGKLRTRTTSNTDTFHALLGEYKIENVKIFTQSLTKIFCIRVFNVGGCLASCLTFKPFLTLDLQRLPYKKKTCIQQITQLFQIHQFFDNRSKYEAHHVLCLISSVSFEP